MQVWQGLGGDIRVVARGLMRTPGFTFTALAVLAVAVAANTAVFAFVRGTLLERPPYENPEAIVLVWGSEPLNGQLRDVVSGANFIDLRQRASSVSALAAVHGDDVVLMRQGRPEVLQALQVTVDFLRVLGIRPALGSDFGEVDRRSKAPPSVIVSHAFWREVLGAGADVVGRTLEIDGALTTVVGVLPAGFRFAGEWQLYLPLRDDDLAGEDRTHHHYNLVGRLRQGVGAADASRELSSILAEISVADPRLARWSVLVEPMLEVTVEAVRPALWLTAGAAVLVLAVSLVNLGTLLRVRTLQRFREFAVRAALGARRGRVVSLVVVEALMLSAAGAAIGLLLSPFALDLLSSVAPPQVLIPNSAAAIPVLRASLTPWLLITVFALALASSLLLATPSLWTAMRQASDVPSVKAGHRVIAASSSQWMVGAELTMATLLAVAAGLMIRSVSQLSSRDPGVDSEAVLTAYFGNVDALPVKQRAEYFRLVLAAVERVPGVRRAAIKDYRPFEGEDDFKGIRFPERPPPPRGEGVREEWRRVSEGYFQTVGMRLVRGSFFTAGDVVGTPRSAVINQAFSDKHYGGDNPVGRRLVLAEPGYADVAIVGVVGNVLSRGVTEPPPPVVYVPYQAAPRGHVALFVKVDGDPFAYGDAVREAIWSVDAKQPVLPMVPLAQVIARSMAIPTMMSRIVGVMALVALTLASFGVFGVVAYAVRSRRQELAIRMALGAAAARLTRDLVVSFARTLAVSLAAGLLGAALGLDGLRAVLYGVRVGDPFVFVAAAALVGTLGLLAAYLPAKRVSRVDPARVIQDAQASL
jgi:predicted permease